MNRLENRINKLERVGADDEILEVCGFRITAKELGTVLDRVAGTKGRLPSEYMKELEADI